MIEADVYWPGQSGKEYGYWIHPIGTDLTKDPGNYLYAKRLDDGAWMPLYIGQAANLQSRPGDQENEACAKRNGATRWE